MKTDQQTINELGRAVTDLIEEYGQNREIPPYEIGHQLISQAVSMLMATAPHHLLAMKTILACVENGIAQYEENYKKE